MKAASISVGDSLTYLKNLAADSVDSLVTDPPAGISFMGKDWDGDKGGREHWVAWLTEVMRECHRVLKPGAHGLVWAIPRTSHWTATALENAGFEVRDVITHLFGTGFPKSLDVSKAIDKAAGAAREVVGDYKATGTARRRGGIGAETAGALGGYEAVNDKILITAPATDAARQWSGWGTALKPSVEKWFLVRKQNLTVDTTAFDPLETVLWSRLNASNAESLFKRILATSSEARPGIVPAYALTRAVAEAARLTEIGAAEASSDQMAISPLEAVTITSLSIVWSWKSILAALSDQMSTFITRTAISQIIDYPTLNSLASAITPESIIQAANNPSGTPENVRLVGEFLNDCVQRCEGILTLYAHEHAIGAGQFNQPSLSASRKIESALRTAPFSEEIILIRKPLGEKTVAANVLKHGCGAINIDGCRVGVDANDPNHRKPSVDWQNADNPAVTNFGSGGRPIPNLNSQGRFPANLVLSHNEDCVEVGVKKVGSGSGYNFESSNNDNPSRITKNIKSGIHYGAETVTAWECTPGCAVAELDRQSGILKSGARRGKNKTERESEWGQRDSRLNGGACEASEGGASRFFATFRAENDIDSACDASSAKKNSSQPSPPGDSAQNHAAIGEDRADKLLSAAKVHFTLGTASESALNDEIDTSPIQNTDKRFLLEPPLTSTSLNADATHAETPRPTDTTATIHAHSKCNSSADNAISDTMPLSLEPGAKDSASRFIYCAKASKRDRGEGNGHPTVKSTALMSYLCRLVTPVGGTVLDPFAGSGSTGVAAVREGFNFIGIEMSAEYAAIAQARVNHEMRSANA